MMTWGERNRAFGNISMDEMTTDDVMFYRARITELTTGLSQLISIYNLNKLSPLIKNALEQVAPHHSSGTHQNVLLRYADELLDCYKGIFFEIRNHPKPELAAKIQNRLFKYEDNYPLRFRSAKPSITNQES